MRHVFITDKFEKEKRSWDKYLLLKHKNKHEINMCH